MISFISDQLQLEADAREALPYVKAVLNMHWLATQH